MKKVLNKLTILNFMPIAVGLVLLPFQGLRSAYLFLVLPAFLLGINTNYSYYKRRANFLPNILYMCIISLLWNGIDYLFSSIKSDSIFNPDNWAILYYLISLFINFMIILCMGIVINNSFREKFGE